MKIIIIAAVARNGVIGNNNKIPWHSSEDFKHFKRTTFGFPIIMGRKTFESIGSPLKGRENIVISGNKNYTIPEGVVLKSDLQPALDYCRELNVEKTFIIGGSRIYNDAIYIADELLLSEMKFNAEGNIYFPEFDKSIWKYQTKVYESDEFTVMSYKKTKDE